MTNLYDFLEYYGRYADPPPTWHRAERLIREKYDLTEDHGPSHDALDEDGTRVEIKSCAVEYGDGRPGQFEIWRTQISDLIPDGRVALLVYEPGAGHRVVATRMMDPVDLLYVGTSGWREHSTMGRRRICRIPWPEVFSLENVTFWRRCTYSKYFDTEEVESTLLPGFPNLDLEE